MKKSGFIFYGWFIVGAGILVTALGYGARYSFSVIFPTLIEHFQWSRDVTAAMLSVHIFVYGMLAPIAGGLVDRFGPRRTMTFGVILLAAGLALSGLGGEPWHFYLSFGVLFGVGLSLSGAVPFTVILGNWFERRRALVFSLLFLGSGFSWANYPVIAFLIAETGWQNTFFIEAITIVAVIIPITTLVIRHRPEEKGLSRDGIPINTEISSILLTDELRIRDRAWVAVNWTLQKALKTSRLWFLCLATFSVWGVTEHILVAHQVVFAMDVGYSSIYASSVLALFGVFYVGGSLVSFFSDNIGREAIITIGTVIGISAIATLMSIKDTSQPVMLYYYTCALGLGIGMISPTITATITDIFQGPKVGAIVGFIWFGFSVGGAIGPWLGGWLFETTGSYLMAFLVSIVLFAVSCVAIWLAGPRKVRLVPGKVRHVEKEMVRHEA
jgi:MFS family permease